MVPKCLFYTELYFWVGSITYKRALGIDSKDLMQYCSAVLVKLLVCKNTYGVL